MRDQVPELINSQLVDLPNSMNSALGDFTISPAQHKITMLVQICSLHMNFTGKSQLVQKYKHSMQELKTDASGKT